MILVVVVVGEDVVAVGMQSRERSDKFIYMHPAKYHPFPATC